MKTRLNDLLYANAARFIEAGAAQNMQRIGVSKDDPKFKAALKHQCDLLKQAKLFLVEHNFHDHKIEVVETIDTALLDYALPFKTCYFELNSKDDSLGTVGPEEDPSKYGIHAILINEICPETFSGWLFIDTNGVPGIMPFIIGQKANAIVDAVTPNIDETRSAARNSEKIAGILVDKICRYIHSCHMGVESIFRTVNHKTITFGKSLHKVDHIIRLKQVVSRDYPEPAFSREIDWDMRWWVRGHWRRLPSPEIPGKGRDGLYTVKGFTWVTEHLRGPEDKPIRKSTYILGDTHAPQ